MWNKRNKESHRVTGYESLIEPTVAIKIMNQEGKFLDTAFDLVKFTNEITTLVKK